LVLSIVVGVAASHVYARIDRKIMQSRLFPWTMLRAPAPAEPSAGGPALR
jgi:hypothetical protein